MKFEIDDFVVYTKKMTETLDQMTLVPKKLSYQKTKVEEYELIPKTREFIVFHGLNLIEEDGEYYRVIRDLFDFIDLIEILKAFSSNKLDTSKTYQIGDRFTAKTAQKDGNIRLSIHFKNYSYKLYLDKFECSSLAAKFGKILQRCEAWQELEV